MRYLVNASLHPGKSREDFVAMVKSRPVSPQAWEFARKGTVTERSFKTGRRPGFILIMDAESESDLRTGLSTFPAVQEGWFEIEIEPLSLFLTDIR